MANSDQLLGEVIDTKPAATVEVADQAPNYYELLVGEGKKYADQGNLAKGYANLDAHARTLLDEKKVLENQLLEMGQKVKTGEDILAAIKGGGTDDAAHQAALAAAAAQGQPVSKADVATLVAAALDQRDVKHQQQSEVDQIKANQQATWEKLSKIYGSKDKAKVAVGMYCGDDPVKRDTVRQLGSLNPDALVLIMQTAIKPKGEQVDFGVADLGADKVPKKVLPNPVGYFTYAESLDVKKNNPKLYKSRQFQTRIHQSAAKHPDFWVGIAGHKQKG